MNYYIFNTTLYDKHNQKKTKDDTDNDTERNLQADQYGFIWSVVLVFYCIYY